MTWTIEPAMPVDRKPIERLLTESGLPTKDLAGAWHENSFVVRDGRTVVAVIGLEVHGQTGLVRSLAVAPTHRNRGVASALLEAAEARAVDRGLEALYALTMTAESFLMKRGYGRVDRSTAPAAIRSTAEFRDLCPKTAVCLSRQLA